MRKIAVVSAFVIAVVSVCALAGTPSKKGAVPNLVVLYTSSARGQIRSCDCTKFRFGGYGRQLTLLKSIRQSNKNTVLLEGGDVTGGSGFQAKLKTGVIVRALTTLGYGAIVPGEEELGIVGEQSAKQFEKQPVPLVCANLHDKGQKQAKYKPSVILTTSGGLKVGVIGVIDKALGGDLLEKTFGETVSDPVQAVQSQVSALKRKCDLLIVIYHGPAASAEKLAAIKGIGLVLCTHRSSKDNLFPSKGLNIVDARVESRGNARVVNAGTNANWNLGRIDITLGPNGRIKSAKHTLIYMDRRYAEDPKMVKVYEAYNENVTQAVLGESSKLRRQAEVILLKRGVNIDEARKRLHKSPFATARACEDCHSDIEENWARTRHSYAIDSLKKTKQEYDPECVGCHVTGMLTRNGYVNCKETPQLANVQCEACHGPALDHVKSPQAGFGHVDEQTCRSCHTEERDPEFDYDAYWAKVKH